MSQDHLLQDPVIQMILKHARESAFIKRVILFGSQATGQASPKSDYDIAFELNQQADHLDIQWGAFCVKLRESNPRLNALDLVRMDWISPDFLAKIEAEGIRLA